MAASLGVICVIGAAGEGVALAVKPAKPTSFAGAASQHTAQPKPTGLGGRVSMMRSGQKLKGGALKAMVRKSALGDVEGSRDAREGLDTLRSGGQLGMLGKLQMSRATGKTVTSSLQASQRLAQRGQLGKALESHAWAVELKGRESRATRQAARQIHTTAWQQAEALAKRRDPQATSEALGHAREAAQRAGVKFNAKKAAKLEKQAARLTLRGRVRRVVDRFQARRATDDLFARSRSLHREGRYDEAAEALVEAQELQSRFDLKATSDQRAHAKVMTFHLARYLMQK